jgi:hypothetical protein
MKKTVIEFPSNLTDGEQSKLNEQIKLIICSQTGIKASKIKIKSFSNEHGLLNEIEQNYIWVWKNMKRPSPEECQTLIDKYKYTSIIRCLDSLENRRQIKNNKTVYLTLKTWLKDEDLRPKKPKEEKPRPKQKEVKNAIDRLQVGKWARQLNR